MPLTLLTYYFLSFLPPPAPPTLISNWKAQLNFKHHVFSEDCPWWRLSPCPLCFHSPLYVIHNIFHFFCLLPLKRQWDRSANSQTQKPSRLKMEPVKWQKSGPWWWLESPNSSCMSKSVLGFLYTCHFSWSHSDCSESGVIANLAFSQCGVEAEWVQILGMKEMRISLRRDVWPWHPQTVIAKVSGPPAADWRGEKCCRLRSSSHHFQLCLENWH